MSCLVAACALIGTMDGVNLRRELLALGASHAIDHVSEQGAGIGHLTCPRQQHGANYAFGCVALLGQPTMIDGYIPVSYRRGGDGKRVAVAQSLVRIRLNSRLANSPPPSTTDHQNAWSDCRPVAESLALEAWVAGTRVRLSWQSWSSSMRRMYDVLHRQAPAAWATRNGWVDCG